MEQTPWTGAMMEREQLYAPGHVLFPEQEERGAGPPKDPGSPLQTQLHLAGNSGDGGEGGEEEWDVLVDLVMSLGTRPGSPMQQRVNQKLRVRPHWPKSLPRRGGQERLISWARLSRRVWRMKS